MKNLPVYLSSIALVGVIVLFALHFSSPKSNKTITAKAVENTGASGLKIAYVDIDSFEANYDYLKTKRSDFERRQKSAEAELQRSAQQYQSTLQNLQQKAPTMTESEGKAAEQKLMQMQESLRLREQSLSETIGKDKEAFNKELQQELDSFLADYNENGAYDYILSYSKSLSLILFAKDEMNITADVIKGMNERAEDKKKPASASK